VIVRAGVAAAVLLATGSAPLLVLPPELTESSGVATSSVSPEWFFTHEDSGAAAEFSAVSTDGRLLATYVLPGVQARDWEDMARGPDGQGGSSLLLGDIGDNNAARDRGLLVHRVPEPTPDLARTGVELATEPPVSYRLRYDDGPRDAETLLVHPRTGRLYVVTKPLGGSAGLYAAPETLDADGPNALVRVADVNGVRATGTPGGPRIGGLAQLLVTGGDIAPDGSRVALRTYTDLYEWPLDSDDVAAAVQGEPVVTALPPTMQGEGVAYTRDGSSLLLTSEGESAPVHRVPAAELESPDGAALAASAGTDRRGSGRLAARAAARASSQQSSDQGVGRPTAGRPAPASRRPAPGPRRRTRPRRRGAARRCRPPGCSHR
jgi:hypothetical protein